MRTISIDSLTARHLAAYLDLHAERAEWFFKLHPDRKPSDLGCLPLFPGVSEFRRGQRQRQQRTDLLSWEFTNERAEPTALRHGWFTQRYWAAIRAKAQVPESVVFYDLRHFHASWHAARLGQPGALTIAELSERLGHASTQMTLDRYVHVEPNVDKRNASAGMFADDTESNVVAFPA